MAFGQNQKFSLRTDRMSATQAQASKVDVGLREYMLRIYNYMASGLALTGIIAFFSASTPAIFNLIYTVGPNGGIGMTEVVGRESI